MGVCLVIIFSFLLSVPGVGYRDGLFYCTRVIDYRTRVILRVKSVLNMALNCDALRSYISILLDCMIFLRFWDLINKQMFDNIIKNKKFGGDLYERTDREDYEAIAKIQHRGSGTVPNLY